MENECGVFSCVAGRLHRDLAWVGTVPWCVYVKVGAEGGVGVEGGRGKGEGGRGRVARRRKKVGGGGGGVILVPSRGYKA